VKEIKYQAKALSEALDYKNSIITAFGLGKYVQEELSFH
jgi:hypothetical protein